MATISAPTLVSRRQPLPLGGDRARPFGQPHRAQHRDDGGDEPEERAQGGHRINAPRPAGRRRAPRAGRRLRLAARCASARASHAAVALLVCAGIDFTRSTALARSAAWRAASARASLASADIALDIVADAAQRDEAAQLAQQPLAVGIVGQVVGQGRLGDGGELGCRARRARRRRSARRAAARLTISVSLASPWTSGVSKMSSVAKGRPASIAPR